MRIYIDQDENGFEVGDLDASGAAKVGRAETMDAALGDFLRSHQRELGITEIQLNSGAQATEMRRRETELAKR